MDLKDEVMKELTKCETNCLPSVRITFTFIWKKLKYLKSSLFHFTFNVRIELTPYAKLDCIYHHQQGC